MKVTPPAALKSRVEDWAIVPPIPTRLLELEMELLFSNLTYVELPEILTLPTAALLSPDTMLVPFWNEVVPV